MLGISEPLTERRFKFHGIRWDLFVATETLVDLHADMPDDRVVVGCRCADADVVLDDVDVGVGAAILLGPECEERTLAGPALGVDDQWWIVGGGMLVESFEIEWIGDVGTPPAQRECGVTGTLLFKGCRWPGVCEVMFDDPDEIVEDHLTEGCGVAETLDRGTTRVNPLLILFKPTALGAFVRIVIEGLSLTTEVEPGLLQLLPPPRRIPPRSAAPTTPPFMKGGARRGWCQYCVVRFHLGDAHTVDRDLFDPRKLLEQCGIFLDVEVGWNVAISIAGDANEVWPAVVDFFKTGADDLAERNVLIGQPPPQIDLGERDPSLTAERADLREDLLHEMLALFLQVAERRRDKHPQFTATRHRITNAVWIKGRSLGAGEAEVRRRRMELMKTRNSFTREWGMGMSIKCHCHRHCNARRSSSRRVRKRCFGVSRCSVSYRASALEAASFAPTLHIQ